jgi:hypothetical protein
MLRSLHYGRKSAAFGRDDNILGWQKRSLVEMTMLGVAKEIFGRDDDVSGVTIDSIESVCLPIFNLKL